MARLKIDFGIDLGTTNSAIAVNNKGVSKILKTTDVQADTMPSCVMTTKKGFLVGAKAFALLPRDKKKAFTDTDFKSNIFIEFKRTMGNTTQYITDKGDEFSSEDLSSEVLKTLKSFVNDENVRSAVITIPAAFEMNQINATKKAAELAGLEYVELVQEPYAAAIAYANESKNKNGFWLVFDFGGGTFDSALIKVEEGIIKVIDTEGDNFLGGKNLDEAIVDEIFIPYLKENYVIDSIISNTEKFQAFKEMWKPLAEDAKNQLSFKEEYDILTNLYDEYGVDDKGEEFEIEMSINRVQLKEIFKPFIQRAIDISNKLLKRNNLNGGKLDELIFVGGPTLSPIIREMVEVQIRKPNTSVDPMTVVAIGASIYASSLNNEIGVEIDESKIQLKIDYDSKVVGEEAWINLKTLNIDNNDKYFVEIAREDKAWKSEKTELNNMGDVIEVTLVKEEINNFEILLYNEKGNKIDCEPNTFSIKEGTSLGGAPLPHAICIEVIDKVSKEKIIKPLIGLEKNKTLPTNGVINGLKTTKQIRPGMDDKIVIPIYQGEPFTKAIHNNYVSSIIITGNDLPALLPENSEANLTIKVDRSNLMSGEIDFIDIDYKMEFEVVTENSEITNEWLTEQLNETKHSLSNLNSELIPESKIDELKNKLKSINKAFDNNKTDAGKLEHRSLLQEVAKEIEELNATTEWPKLEEEIKEEFYRLEKANTDLGNEKSTEMVNQLRNQVEEVIETQDVKLGNVLLEEIGSLFVQITLIYQLINFIRQHNESFGSFNWKDGGRARTLLNQGLQQIGENPSVDELHPLVIQIIDLLEEDSKPSDGGLFQG